MDEGMQKSSQAMVDHKNKLDLRTK